MTGPNLNTDDQRLTTEAEEPRSIRDTLESAVADAAKPADQGGAPPVDGGQTLTETLVAPKHWPKEDQEFFASKASDPAVQKWLLGRESRYESGFQKVRGELKQFQDRWKPFEEILAPHREFLTKSNLSEAQVLSNYIAVDQMLAQKPEDALRYIFETHKISPDVVTAALGEAREPNPLESRLAKLETARETEQRQAQERANNEIVSTVTSFAEEKGADGKPVYPLMDDPAVSDLMIRLISSGAVDIAKNGGVIPALKVAYDQAVHANPATRKSIMESAALARTQEEDRKRREQVDKARRLGGQLRGNGSGSSTEEAKRGGDLRTTLHEAARKAGLNT